MKNKILILLFLVVALFSTNCTIQKRTVKKGYFVQWNFNKNNVTPSILNLDQENEFSKYQSTRECSPQIVVDNENISDLEKQQQNIFVEDVSSNSAETNCFANSSFENCQDFTKKQKVPIASYIKQKKSLPKNKLETISFAAKTFTIAGVILFLIGLFLVLYFFSNSFVHTIVFLVGLGLGFLGIVFFLIGLMLIISFYVEKRKQSK